jgi:hypothetical protein
MKDYATRTSSLDLGMINTTYGLWETQSPLLGSMSGGMDWTDDGNGMHSMQGAVPITPPPTSMMDVRSCHFRVEFLNFILFSSCIFCVFCVPGPAISHLLASGHKTVDAKCSAWCA